MINERIKKNGMDLHILLIRKITLFRFVDQTFVKIQIEKKNTLSTEYDIIYYITGILLIEIFYLFILHRLSLKGSNFIFLIISIEFIFCFSF